MNEVIINENIFMEKNTDVVRILIIDDDEEDFFITSEYIRNIEGQQFQLDWCYKYNEAVDHILKARYDLYFVDYRLGAQTGLDLIRDVKRQKSDQPIILLTGKGTKEIDVQSMEAGASDYLIKSELNTEKLERSIRYALSRAHFVKALKSNEQKFRNMFERSKDAVFLTDESLVFNDANDAAIQLFGYPKEELLQTSLYSLILNEEDKIDIQKNLDSQGFILDKEMVLMSKRGSKIYGIFSVSKEANMNGTVYLQGIIHDITKLKKAERINLQTEKLRSAGRLVRILAHEVRNPLNNINLSLEQLTNEFKNEEADLYFSIIERNSKRIADIISQLLNSSLPAEIILMKQPLQEILTGTIGAARDRITLKKLKLVTRFPKKPAMIMADAEKLNLAFLNIIINAIESMENEKGTLEVSIASEEDLHKVIIRDTGAGISEENISLMFEPYFTSKKAGLGLGLSTSLNILQSHKAVIEVQSQLNQGTAFILQFQDADMIEG